MMRVVLLAVLVMTAVAVAHADSGDSSNIDNDSRAEGHAAALAFSRSIAAQSAAHFEQGALFLNTEHVPPSVVHRFRVLEDSGVDAADAVAAAHIVSFGVLPNKRLRAECERTSGVIFGDYIVHKAFVVSGTARQLADLLATCPGIMDVRAIDMATRTPVALRKRLLRWRRMMLSTSGEDIVPERRDGAPMRMRFSVGQGLATRVADRLNMALSQHRSDSGAERSAFGEGPWAACPAALHFAAASERIVVSRPAVVSVSCKVALVELVAAQPEAIAIEEMLPLRGQMSDASWGTQGGVHDAFHKTPVWDAGLHGEDEIVTIGDSGVDVKHCNFFDPTVTMPVGGRNKNLAHRKIVAYNNDFTHDTLDQAGHGSACAGIIAGFSNNGDENSARYHGLAHNAKIAVWDMGTDSTMGLDGPEDLSTTMFPWGYDLLGSSIFSGSFGGDALGGYTFDSQAVDSYSWKNQFWVAFFGAGNSGSDSGFNHFYTLDAPATGKSPLAVGSAPNPRSGKSNEVSTFSSLGPTVDGRIKPDIIAIGDPVITSSAHSNPNENHCAFNGLSGTSFSCPMAAGSATLIRQYFRAGYYPSGRANAADGFKPMGSLIKAMLILSAEPMNGIVRSKGSQSALGEFGTPNFFQGFGLIALTRAMYLADTNRGMGVRDANGMLTSVPRRLYVHQDDKGLESGGFFVKCFSITSASSSTDPSFVRIVLAWSDPPASLQSKIALVNNLDLELETETGTVIYGNHRAVFMPQDGPVTNTSATATDGERAAFLNERDTLNTVERISYYPVYPGRTYMVTVRGTFVPDGPQPFSLVIDFPGSELPAKAELTMSGPMAQAGATLSPETTPGPNDYCAARLSSCPLGCSGIGLCYLNHCTCPPGRGGLGCEIVAPKMYARLPSALSTANPGNVTIELPEVSFAFEDGQWKYFELPDTEELSRLLDAGMAYNMSALITAASPLAPRYVRSSFVVSGDRTAVLPSYNAVNGSGSDLYSVSALAVGKALSIRVPATHKYLGIYSGCCSSDFRASVKLTMTPVVVGASTNPSASASASVQPSVTAAPSGSRVPVPSASSDPHESKTAAAGETTTYRFLTYLAGFLFVCILASVIGFFVMCVRMRTNPLAEPANVQVTLGQSEMSAGGAVAAAVAAASSPAATPSGERSQRHRKRESHKYMNVHSDDIVDESSRRSRRISKKQKEISVHVEDSAAAADEGEEMGEISELSPEFDNSNSDNAAGEGESQPKDKSVESKIVDQLTRKVLPSTSVSQDGTQ